MTNPPEGPDPRKATYDELRQLHAQVVADLLRAKARGDKKEAARLRQWVRDLVVQQTPFAIESVLPLAESAQGKEARACSVAASIARDRQAEPPRPLNSDELAQLQQLSQDMTAAALMGEALAAFEEHDAERGNRLLRQVCELLGFPLERYGLDEAGDEDDDE